MRLILISFLSFFLGVDSALQAQIIPVKTARVRVLERKLEGFQVLVRKSRPEVRQGITNHLGAYASSPVAFEDFMIYERVSYPPVSVSQPISFFYQLEDVSGIMTRLTLVGSYDYQRSINILEAPDLSLRLLLDLGELVRKISGDTINFDPLFKETTAAELRQKYAERKTKVVYEDIVERKRDWVGDIGETRVKKDPFAVDYQEPEMKEDEAIVENISARFQEYLKQTPTSNSVFLDDVSSEQAAQYRDSLMALNQQIDELRAVLIQSTFTKDSLVKYIARLENGPEEQVDTLLDSPLARIDEGEFLSPTEQQAWDSLLTEHKALEKQVGEYQAQIQTAKNFEAKQDSLIKKLQSDILQAAAVQDPKAQIAQLEMERQELYQVQEADRTLIQILRERLSDQELILKRNQSLMQAKRDSFIQEIATLNPESEPAQMRRQVYLKQQKDLEAAQIDLEQREWEVKIRETRIAQRERFLAEYELKGKESQLMERIGALESRIDQLNNERIRYDTRKKDLVSEIRIDPASTTYQGNTVPAFSVKSEHPPSLLREQILEWARLKKLETSGEQEEVWMKDIKLRELSDEPLTLRFSFSLQNSGKSLLFVSFQEGNDEFIRTASNSLRSRKAYALLLQIFE